MKWNPDILHKFLAPGIAEFTAADIPDISDAYPQATYWLRNHFLNNALRSSFKDRWRQVVLAFIRRAHNSFHAYHDARKLTLKYLDGNEPHNPRVSQYFDAVSTWENFALQVSMAMDLFRWLNQGEGAFKKNDGSNAQRLYDITNLIKHTASAVSSGQCTEADTVPLWLTNNGLHSFGLTVSYKEASEVLDAVLKLADVCQDPHSLSEKWSKKHAS